MKRLKLQIKLIKKQALICLAFVFVLIFVLSGVQIARADWQEPTVAPPVDNIPAPISSGSEPQAKSGYLRLDAAYNSEDVPTNINYPLEVEGTGWFNIVEADNLQASDTLYVDSLLHKVKITEAGVSLAPTIADGILSVDSGRVYIGGVTAPLAGQAVYSNSAAGHGIMGTSLFSGMAGIYGISVNASGFGVQGVSSSSGGSARSGIYGSSIGGYGIYGLNNSATQAAVYGENTATADVGWAGYFDGMLGAGGDVVSSRFLPTDLRISLLPFTSGQEVAAYDYGIWDDEIPTFSRVAFDGTYVWVATNRDDTSPTRHTLFKVRASDGTYLKSYRFGWSEWALAFDGKYLWILSYENDLHRLDPATDDVITISAADLGLTYADESRYITTSTINGQAYIWVIDNDDNRIVRVSTSNLSPPFDDYDLTSNTLIPGNPGITSPVGITFDGQYIWVAAGGSGHLVRLWAEDPDNPPNPNIAFDTTTASLDCNPVSVIFDGVNVWCTPNGATDQLVRVWPDDPSDPQHPAQGFGSIAGHVKGATTDGTYLWAAELQTGRLYRFLLADPTQETFFETTVNQPESLVFDGTYIWTADEMINQPQLHKLFTGTGFGHTDLNSSVNLITNPGVCRNSADPDSSSNDQCYSTAGCTSGEICSYDSVQQGNINISGSAEIGLDLNVGSDVEATGNLWGGGVCESTTTACESASDCGGADCVEDVVDVTGDIADCSVDGYFIKGIYIDGNGKLDNGSIICRGL